MEVGTDTTHFDFKLQQKRCLLAKLGESQWIDCTAASKQTRAREMCTKESQVKTTDCSGLSNQ